MKFFCVVFVTFCVQKVAINKIAIGGSLARVSCVELYPVVLYPLRRYLFCTKGTLVVFKVVLRWDTLLLSPFFYQS